MSHAELTREQLEADVKFLSFRHYLKNSDSSKKFIGISSDSLVDFAYGRRKTIELPADGVDLHRCCVAIDFMPEHRRTGAVIKMFVKQIQAVPIEQYQSDIAMELYTEIKRMQEGGK